MNEQEIEELKNLSDEEHEERKEEGSLYGPGQGNYPEYHKLTNLLLHHMDGKHGGIGFGNLLSLMGHCAHILAERAIRVEADKHSYKIFKALAKALEKL